MEHGQENVSTVHLVLQELLDANKAFALTAKGTTNHCPMALVALARMGAMPDRLRDFFTMWQREFALPAGEIGTPILRGKWPSQLGVSSSFSSLQLCFHDWMKEQGIAPVLETVLSQIQFAPATGAFHALIRLAYGLDADHLGEISAGLAYLVSGNLAIGLTMHGRAFAANPK